jgi:hypothetical protein
MMDPSTASTEVKAALAPLSRRRFLTTALWAGAGVMTLAFGSFAWLRRSPIDELSVPDGLLVLSADQYRFFHRMAELLLPTDGTHLVPVSEVLVADHIDELLAALDADIRKQLGIGLSIIDNAAVFSHGYRLVDLSPEKAQAYVNNWVNSENVVKRTLGAVVSRLVHTGYWMDEHTWPAIEYDGPVSKRWGIPSLGNQPLPA